MWGQRQKGVGVFIIAPWPVELGWRCGDWQMPRKMSQAKITSPDTHQKVECQGVSWINFGVGKVMCVLSLIALDLLSFCGVHDTAEDATWLDEVSPSRQISFHCLTGSG